MLGDIDDPIMLCTFIITIVNIHTLIIDICVFNRYSNSNLYCVQKSQNNNMMELMQSTYRITSISNKTIKDKSLNELNEKGSNMMFI